MTALDKLTEHHTPAPPVDITIPVTPDWVRDRDAATGTAALVARRGVYRTKRFLVHLPKLLLLLVAYCPRGFGRLVARLGRYLYDYDSAEIRHTHAGNAETKEYAAAARIRSSNLRARWMVASTIGVILIGPILAWTYPYILSGIVGAALFVWTVKLIPGKEMWELGVALGVAVGTWWFLPLALVFIPSPPIWGVAVVLAAAVFALGWYGRPLGKALVQRDDPAAAGIPEKPSAPVVLDALCRIGVTNLTEKTREEIRVFAPGVARSKRGYHLSMELPPGVSASSVMDKREAFAAALRRELGTVWPKKGERHPGHLELFISDLPMATAPQSKWQVTEGEPLDFFRPIPMFTDQEGQWTPLTLAYNHMVVGGAPGYGKSFAVRQIGVAVAFDPRVRITCLDGKGNGDLRPLRLVAHGFYEGDEPEEIAEQLAAVTAIREEMRRRAKFLRDLPREENPQSKVTSELVDRYPHLAPIVLLVDETQVYTENDDPKVKEAFVAAFTDLVKRGRSAGIVPVFCTQKPDAKSLPSGIADNCSVRLCFRVNGWRANDQVLGTEMHNAGVKATLFSSSDKGLAWLRGDGTEPAVVRTVYGLDAVAAEELMMVARDIRERRGLLTGQAAGEDAEREEQQVSLLADCRFVMDSPAVPRMHLATLLEGLQLLRPGIWGHLDTEALGGMLRTAGVPVAQVKVDGRNTSGVRRETLDVAATSDIDPDEDGGMVIPIGR